MTPAITELRQLRHVGITVTIDGGDLIVNPPEKVSPAIVHRLRIVKSELLHVLAGDYTHAACALILREIPAGALRDDLIHDFDERLAIHQHDGEMSYGAAARESYRALAKQIEQIQFDHESKLLTAGTPAKDYCNVEHANRQQCAGNRMQGATAENRAPLAVRHSTAQKR